jgi:hypothetical protein
MSGKDKASERAEKLLRAWGEIDSRFVEEADPEKTVPMRRRRFPIVRAGGVLAAALAVMVIAGVFVAVQPGERSGRITAESPETAQYSGADQGPAAAEGNPFADYSSLAEAETAAGFAVSAPESVGDSRASEYRVMDGVMIEVIYRNADGEETLRVRKEKLEAGEQTEDISGDYTEYDTTKTREENGVTYTLSGNGDTISKVIWTDGDYAYAIDCAEPLSESGAMRLAGELGGDGK